MTQDAISNWIKERLMTFNVDAEHLDRLSSYDMLYLYGEIYLKYGIRISVQKINQGCFCSVEKLSEAILTSILAEGRCICNEKT